MYSYASLRLRKIEVKQLNLTDPDKLSGFRRLRSGLVNDRPFTVCAKGIKLEECKLYCHVVEEDRTSHMVRQYQLLENENGQHSLCAFREDSSRKLLGAPITTDVAGKAVAVGALTFRNKQVCPIFFSQLNLVVTCSGR